MITITRIFIPYPYVSFGFVSDLYDHVIIEGAEPEVAVLNPEEPVEVLVSDYLAAELGLQVGEEYLPMLIREAVAVATESM